ncbi:MAG: four-carbon acid sugar kinase family protein [Actinomycetota bacterium]|nr:four-carbon acid sugar kinase family protein [Actinomycetota bacterium]
MKMPDAALVVTADDSTGATEAGASCADAGWRVEVVPYYVASSAAECVVVDLRSRHVPPLEARRRTIALATDARHVHKIDSTLRGNWAAELSALVEIGRRVVLVPSHPPLGRVCVGGVVLVDGVPVAETEHGNDPRMPVHTSRPSDWLTGIELASVELAGAEEFAAWIAGSDQAVAIVDASTLADIEQIVAVALDAVDVVIAGPASVVGAVARACAPRKSSPLPLPWLPAPVVAVCASLHSASRSQMAALAASGLDVEVAMSPDDRAGDADAIAVELAGRAHRLVGELQARSVILVGGDTAAAFIGDAAVAVYGSVGVGISLGEATFGRRRLRLACKPGGFGTTNTLVDLVKRGMQR